MIIVNNKPLYLPYTPSLSGGVEVLHGHAGRVEPKNAIEWIFDWYTMYIEIAVFWFSLLFGAAFAETAQS